MKPPTSTRSLARVLKPHGVAIGSSLLLLGACGAPSVRPTQEPPSPPTAIAIPDEGEPRLVSEPPAPEPGSSCLAMLVDHEAPAACPEGATLECTLQQGLELWRRKDFPAAASVFIPLAEQQDAELGLAATEYAIASLHALLQERPSCEIVLLEFAPRMAERHCPATPSPGTCHMIQEVQFMVLRNRALRVATDDPTTWVGLFERFCAEGGPFNNQHAAPLDAECDDVLSNAYRLAKRAGNSQLSERLRAALLDPANRLKGSRITEDFDP